MRSTAPPRSVMNCHLPMPNAIRPAPNGIMPAAMRKAITPQSAGLALASIAVLQQFGRYRKRTSRGQAAVLDNSS